MKKVTYYRKEKDGFIESKGYRVVSKGVTLVLEKIGNCWNVTEESTGLKVPITSNKTQQQAIEAVTQKEMIQAIKKTFASDSIKKAVNELKDYKKTLKEETQEENASSERLAHAKKGNMNDLNYTGYWETHVQKFIDLASIHHPARGGNAGNWKKVVNLFAENYNYIKDMHKYASGSPYIQTTTETAEEMVNIVNSVMECNGLNVEMVGRFMWTSGKQKEYSKVLKSLGFTYQENKSKWCRSYNGYVRQDGKKFSFARIKQMYAVQDEA